MGPRDKPEDDGSNWAVGLDGVPPVDIIRAAHARFGPRLALVSSFGAESAVLLHMAAQVDPAIPVVFLETGMLFGQTLDHRKRLAERLRLTDVRDIHPDPVELAATDPTGLLHRTDVDACCHVRKVLPLDQALGGFDAWITGRKRFQGGDRLRLSVVETDTDGKTKVNPLANWTKGDIDAYAAEHDLPAHPLVAQGYPSIGCWPCTRPVEEGQDERAGRWAGLEKTECGIHVTASGALGREGESLRPGAHGPADPGTPQLSVDADN
jgi:phosphoadenosine phosphosulfate reductase